MYIIMIGFQKKNINPKGKKTGDCVVRALAVALSREYYDVYAELYQISVETGFIVNDKRVEERFMARHGFIKHKQPRKSNGKKYLVAELDQVTSERVVVVSCAHHLTVVVGGVLIDSWDPRGKCIGNFYTLGG